MQIKADSPEEYINAIPEERQKAFAKLRESILFKFTKGF
jgi:hypothetical protein